MYISGINKSVNMIHDIDDSVVKVETQQQLHPITAFGQSILSLETNPEILDNIASYVSCSMELGAREISNLLHNKANELRQQFYDVNKPDVSMLFNNEPQVSEERTMRR